MDTPGVFVKSYRVAENTENWRKLAVWSSVRPNDPRGHGINDDELAGWLLEFYILATSRFISGWVLTCDSAYPWILYGASH